MSYLRYSQEGQYVDIPNGSREYIYDTGSDINGWTYGEFAAIIFDALFEADVNLNETYFQALSDAFVDYFDYFDWDYSGDIPQPEKAEIFCQCVDSRFDDVELTEDLQEAMQNSFGREEVTQ